MKEFCDPRFSELTWPVFTKLLIYRLDLYFKTHAGRFSKLLAQQMNSKLSQLSLEH